MLSQIYSYKLIRSPKNRNGISNPKARIVLNLNHSAAAVSEKHSGLETEFTTPMINAHYYNPTFMELNQL